MNPLEITLILLACALVLGLTARRFGMPYPIALTFGGLALGFVPGLPTVVLDPQIVFTVFLPPILYQAALTTSWRDFRADLRAIFLLAVGLVVTTTLAVGFVAYWLIPGLPLAVAFVLGAIVSPPDAVAATAVMRKLRLPQRVVTVLEGESLVNDASGLVLYNFAIAAVLTGQFSPSQAGVQFLVVAIGGVLFGFILGRLAVALHSRFADPLLEITLSLILPFAAYLAAEAVHVSGVLAVVVAGLVRGWYAPEIFAPQSRQLAVGVWEVVVFVLTSLIFILIGLQLPQITAGLAEYSWGELIFYGAAVSLTAIAVRFAWVFPAIILPRLFSRRLRRSDPTPPWQTIFVIAWSGMRGVVSLAAALAVPLMAGGDTPFPSRDLVIFLAFSVILATLVGQGLTLGPLINRLNILPDGRLEDEERGARLETAHAAVAAMDRLVTEEGIPDALADPIREEYSWRIVALTDPETLQLRHETPEARDRRRLRLAAIAAQRERLLMLRRNLVIGDEVLRRLERELDLEQMRLS
jgi:CPA1 family monovalent cation:H+ antiporter